MDRALDLLQQQNDDTPVSETIDFDLFQSFNKKLPIYRFFEMTPNDFNSYDKKNKEILIKEYYEKMKEANLLQVMSPPSNSHSSLVYSRNRSVFNGTKKTNEEISLSLNNNKEKDANGKRYFNVDPKFQNDGGFDISLPKTNLPDRTLFYANDVYESYSEKDKEKFFYLNSVIIAQTLEIEDGDLTDIQDDETVISVSKYKDNRFEIKKVKAVTNVRGEDGVVFYDFGYDPKSYPLQKSKKELPDIFSSTLFLAFKRGFKEGLVDPNEHLQTLFFILPMTD